MHHDLGLIATLSVALPVALAGGLLVTRLRLPAIVGYLLAGVAVGPFTPGFVADANLAPQLAEVGVILLMFGVGAHCSVRDLLSVRGVAIPGALGQSAIATALAVGLALAWGWTVGEGVVLGLAVSVASTVVLLRALAERALVDTRHGRVAIGWLIVEDLFTVVALVLLPAVAPLLGAPSGEGAPAGDVVSAGGLALSILATLAKVGLLVVVTLVVGVRAVPWLLGRVARTESKELFTLAVLATALGYAFAAAQLSGVSFALGAFLAGLAVGESELGHRAAEGALPFQDAFAVLFFVSVGMLFDPGVLVRNPAGVVAVVALIVVAKPLAAVGIVAALRRPLGTGLVVGVGLGQIGEFSFILAELGRSVGLLSAEGHGLILAGALFSIVLNPLLFRLAGLANPSLDRHMHAEPTTLEALNAVPPGVDLVVDPEAHKVTPP